MTRIFLIDGHALAYRAYFALTGAGGTASRWITSKGEPTAGTYGFTSALLSLLEKDKPEYLAVAFDTGRSFRDDIFPAYKATRAKMPDDLRPQIDRIRQVVRAFHIPILEAEGYEADDVLGTVARRLSAAGQDVLILTGDRDLLQLVDPHIRIRLAGKSLAEAVDFDETRFQQDWGFVPGRLVEYKALVGDKSDNIPGVPGVGEKTAAELMQKYTGLEDLYSHLEELPTRWRTKLAEGKDSAYLSQQLATIHTDVQVTFDLESCRVGAFSREEIAPLFQELEFRTLLQRLPGPSGPAQMDLFAAETKTASPITGGRMVGSLDELRGLVTRLSASPMLAIDTETTSTDPMRAELVGMSLSWEEGSGYYLPLRHTGGPNLDWNAVADILRTPLADPRLPKAGHNAKYDWTILERAGLTPSAPAFDTMVAEWLCNPASRNLGLKDMGFIRLGVEMTPIEQLIGKGAKQITMDLVPAEKAAAYASADAEVTLRLVAPLRKDLQERNQVSLFQDVEMPLIGVLGAMEQEGVRLDESYLEGLGRDWQIELQQIEVQAQEIAGRPFNLNSTQQLADVLFGQLGLTPPDASRKTAAGKYSTAADVLEGMRGQHPILDMVLRHRELSKLRSTYVEALRTEVHPATGRVHTSYNQTGTVTGRLSSSDPNLQNIPTRTTEGRRIRRAFIAAPGNVLISIDYSQVELRLAAHMANDGGMIEAFRRGEDIHAATAAAVYGVPLAEVTPAMRRHAKAVNFGLLYGQTAFGLTRSSDLTLAEADEFIKKYFERFSGIRGYVDGVKREAVERGYVETLLGRRRYFPELAAGSRIDAQARGRAEREAINAPVQGTAADVMKLAMIRMPAALDQAGFGARMILQVHDELVFETPAHNARDVVHIARQVMESAMVLSIPLQADAKIGLNWEEMQPVGRN
jgi:DNA polymerase I